ncbi:zinc finger protein 830-like isoform X2 [Patiria miniata]|uniref:Zinc finger protein 830 n=1 Tax=Patiria miniata TaxID=46514 RepID=A0A914BNI2_PATMI|nr:zinc finger protein 830-like isoform X2 [Patiria miniata]
MASSSSKKKVDLRDLMKKQRAESKATSKRIESPLAKYNSVGQLVCVVCNCQVKSEIVWPAHLQGKKHKENLSALRQGNAPNVPQQKPVSTQLHTTQTTAKRKAEYEVTSTVSEKKPRESSALGSTKGLPAGFFDNEIKSPPSVDEAKKSSSSSVSETVVSSSLPSDFFDSGAPSKAASKPSGDEEVSTSNTTNGKTKERKPSTTAEAIPEGFFDDPVMDAKVRKVEVKNTMEEEWSKFQKEMQEENQVSENIQVEDEEAAQVDRNIDEIDEQIHCFAKVEALRDKQDTIKSEMEAKMLHQPSKSKTEEGNSGSADEAEFEEFLDWRSKGAWK